MSDYINNIEKKPNTKKDVLVSFLVIIVVFLFVFLFVTIREHGARNVIETLTTGVEEDLEEEKEPEEVLEEGVEIIESEEDEEDRTENNIDRTKEVQGDGSTLSYYKITAQRGEGLTHLARTALDKHIRDNDITLSSEQKVYAEDYIQRRMQEERDGSDLVLLDEEVGVSYNHVKAGVDKALNLTDYQINNLTQFTFSN